MSKFERDLTDYELFLESYDNVMAYGSAEERDEKNLEYDKRRRYMEETYGGVKAEWIYSQSTGILTNKSKGLSFKGYSGAPGYINDPTKQEVRGKGVIPVGFYKILPPVDSQRTGKYVLNLAPYNENNMFGRSAFQIHGDSVKAPGTASNGCIIINQPHRKTIWESGDRDLEVIA